MTFADAGQHCSDLGSALATPETQAQSDFYASLVDEFTPISRSWVGIEKLDGTWMRDDTMDLTWENWATGKGATGNVAVSTTTDLNYEGGPWNGVWEDMTDDGSRVAHVFCRAFSSLLNKSEPD